LAQRPSRMAAGSLGIGIGNGQIRPAAVISHQTMNINHF